MAFHESYGELPDSTLRLIKRSNVSPSDYDHVLAVLGYSWSDDNIDFSAVEREIRAGTVEGNYRWYW